MFDADHPATGSIFHRIFTALARFNSADLDTPFSGDTWICQRDRLERRACVCARKHDPRWYALRGFPRMERDWLPEFKGQQTLGAILVGGGALTGRTSSAAGAVVGAHRGDASALCLNNSVADRISHERGRRIEIEFAHGGGAVRFHRLQADVQKLPDFLVRMSFGDELDHAALSVGKNQLGTAGTRQKGIEQRGGHLACEEWLMLDEQLHGLDENSCWRPISTDSLALRR